MFNPFKPEVSIPQPESSAPAEPGPVPEPRGLRFSREFAHLPEPEGPQWTEFDSIQWTTRDVVIHNPEGRETFRQDGVVAPAFWSDLAVRVVASKFFYGELGTPEREESVCVLVDRVVDQIADWGGEDGYFATWGDMVAFREDLQALCLHQHAAFNSPVWFNVGLSRSYGVQGSQVGYVWNSEPLSGRGVEPCQDAYVRPQASACFIQSVDDDLASIMELARSEAMLFKYGSGSGTDLSTIRSHREKLSGGGKPSGPLSFMRIYDAGASVIKSGGKTRRAAKMQTLKVGHPDIRQFVAAKPTEDRKARALMAAGYSGGMDGEAYSSVLFQNCNLSVRATDEFLRQAEEYDETTWVTAGVTGGTFDTGATASQILNEIALATYDCGDPGLQFEDTIDRWHTCPNTAPINSSNPCSEFVFINDSACNLASLNLIKFRRPDGTFDVKRFRAAVRIMIVAQDILVDRASYPTAKIALNSHRFRPLGLGYANLGAYLMAAGLPYDSDEGRDLAGSITSLLGGLAYLTSAEIAGSLGAFEGYELNREPMRAVMRMHHGATRAALLDQDNDVKTPIWQAAMATWDNACVAGLKSGYRNSQTTLLAPTGTIAFMMDCDTSGIEPDFALVKHKALAGGGTLKIVNQTVRLGLESFMGQGHADVDAAVEWIDKQGTLQGFDAAIGGGWLDSHPEPERSRRLAIFDCAVPDPGYGRSIAWQGHVRMMAAVQPFLSGAISKTCNMPATATVADIRAAYLLAWRLGLKAIAIYRDGSKGAQPLSTVQPESVEPEPFPPDELRGPEERRPAGDGNWVEDPAGWLEQSFRTVQSIATMLGMADVFEAHLILAGPEPCGLIEQAVIRLVQNRDLATPAATRTRLPNDRASHTHKFDVNGHEGYLTVGFYPDGRLGEVFITMAKEGSTIGGLMDTLGVSLSIGLQHGVPLETFCRKLAFSRFEPAGFTRNPEIPLAKSVADYLARYLVSRYLPSLRDEFGIQSVSVSVATEPTMPPLPAGALDPLEVVPVVPAPAQASRQYSSDNPTCPECGGLTRRTGSCFACLSCGASLGCS